MNRAVFLDRDGTINVEVDYLHEADKFQLIPGVAKALRILMKKGYKLIVISNQSGVGRGYFTCDDVDAVNNRMSEILGAEGVTLDGIYYCPHAEGDRCECRKPSTYMYKKAAAEHNIDLGKSYMVGDKVTDIKPALVTGSGYGLLLSGHQIDQSNLEQYEGHVFDNLLEFARTIE